MDGHKEDQPCLGLFSLGEAGGIVADCFNFELQTSSRLAAAVLSV